VTLLESWVVSANTDQTDFPLNNLPYGSFAHQDGNPHCCVAIGAFILDVSAMAKDGLLKAGNKNPWGSGKWNDFMALGPEIWVTFRKALIELLAFDNPNQQQTEGYLVPTEDAQLLMPFIVAEFTDFYAGRHHAINVGTLFRGAENALPPNWLHMPIGYNGRASSVVVSGTNIRRPWGQIKGPDDAAPRFAPSAKFDLELELGAIVGTASYGPISVGEADENIFGYVLLNDWSARDIQAWEYQPLGPFQAKATATTISPWIVTRAALEPFRCATPAREIALLDHLKDTGPMLYDIDLEVNIAAAGNPATTITKTNYSRMYYSAAQLLAHHTTSGCPMRVGDLLGSGTISGPQISEYGSLLELSRGGKEPITLDTDETRSFIEDGDTLTLKGAAKGNGFKIGFGACSGTVLPALTDPYKR